MKEFLITTFAIIILLGLSLGLTLIGSRISCQNKYADFPNRFGIWTGCQIKPDDKWIPAESYYFKEE